MKDLWVKYEKYITMVVLGVLGVIYFQDIMGVILSLGRFLVPGGSSGSAGTEKTREMKNKAAQSQVELDQGKDEVRESVSEAESHIDAAQQKTDEPVEDRTDDEIEDGFGNLSDLNRK